jgi:alpha-mannosidase
VVVFNSLGWPRTDLAEVNVGFTQGNAKGIGLVDDAGNDVPIQVEQSTHYGDGGLKTARIAFVARDVPALGYRVFYISEKSQAESPRHLATSAGDTVETPLYHVAFDLASGAIQSLRVKPGDWELFSGPANVVSRQQDRGDLWELYRGLDGGSKIAMTTHQAVPAPGQARFSNEFKREPGTLRIGPVFSEFHVSHPFDSGEIATTVRVYEGLRRIECRTQLVNNEKFVRYQALFPTTIKEGRSYHEIPFGAIERPPGIEFPAQNWVDHGDGKRGLAVLNLGLPGNVVTDGTLMLSLLRAHTLGAYGFGGGYEPGMSSESGFQLGKKRTMRYALVPHAGDWKQAGVYRDGLEFNHPLVARVVAPHPGPLTRRWGFLNVSAPNVVISDMKPARDGGIALRLYEATGQRTEAVAVKLHAKVSSANEANLLEDMGRALSVEDNTVRFDLHPYEIKTIILQVEAQSL